MHGYFEWTVLSSVQLRGYLFDSFRRLGIVQYLRSNHLYIPLITYVQIIIDYDLYYRQQF